MLYEMIFINVAHSFKFCVVSINVTPIKHHIISDLGHSINVLYCDIETQSDECIICSFVVDL